MYRSNIYPKMILLVSFFVLGFSSMYAQPSLELKLQLITADTWGVYVRPNGVTPSATTVTGSAQVTIVMPLGFNWGNLTSVNGLWFNNATAPDPIENPGWTYVSFGWQSGDIPLAAGTETLLFTIKRNEACPDSIYLIDNATDPFNNLPNSYNNNPGNEFSIIDFGVPGNPIYEYLGNYAPSAWSCHDCDGDGVLNAFEDTNGNGVFDVGIDSAAVCDPCDPFHPISATLEFVSGANVICANDLGDTSKMIVKIEGGWPPYEVTYTDGTSNFVDTLYSGDTISVVPNATATYDFVGIVDSFGCTLDTALVGGITVEVHGPISITDDPDNVTECFGNGTFFGIAAANAGDGNIKYKWQVNTGSGWVDVQDGSVYDSTTTDTILIANVANKHNWQYRCKIFTSVCDTVYSAAALLQVEGPITVSTQPANITICDTEDNAFFTAAANNAGAVGTMSYQWQVNSGSGWVDIPNNSLYSNVTTTTVNITAPTVSMDGWQYRMKIYTGTCDTIFTNGATLDIEGPLTITSQPANVSNCAGSEVFFYYQYTNPGGGTVNFQWQQSCDGGATWTNLNNVAPYNNAQGVSLGVTGDTLAITNVVGLNGCQYRVRIRTATCSNVTSSPATLSVSGNVTFSSDPKDITVCSGNDTVFVANASIPQGTFTYGWQLSTDGGVTWSNITLPSGVYSHSQTGAISSGTDTLFISNVAGLYNYRYRAVAFATDCDSVVSKEARLTVEGPLSVLDHPDNVTECSGNPVQFTADIDNPGGASQLVYRWELSVNNGVSWTPLTNNALYGGTGTNTLVISNVAGMHNNQVRLRVGTSTCNVIYTNAATITVEGPITVTDDPDNITLCSGDAATFTSTASVGTAGTLSYQWQVSSDNGAFWTNINGSTSGGVYSGFNTTTLSVSDVTGLYGLCYRLRFTTAECTQVFSAKACMTVEGPIAITTDPVDITECSGDPVFFTVAVDNASLDVNGPNSVQYKWQESVNGTVWNNIDDNITYGGTETDTLLITNILGKDNYQYRVQVWTSTCDTLTSLAATLFVEGPLTVIDEPDNVAECSGSGVTFQATISNAGLGTILYQWERSCDLGVTWQDITAGGPNGYSGVTTTTLNISDIVGLDSCRFRLRYSTATCDPARTNYAVLQEEGPISFTAHPVSDTICSGNPVCFSVETANATNTGLITYQWQVKPDGVATWSNLSNNSNYSGTKTANMCIANVTGLDSASYRVLIQTAHCAAVASNAAVLRVEGPITFSDQPDDITQCSAEGVTFSAVANIQAGNIGTLTYQWQTSSDNINWTNVANGGPNGYTGATTPTLGITDVVSLNGRRYRLCVRTTECNPVYSNTARLTVEGPLSVVADPVDLTNCHDKEALLTADLLNPGQGAIQYQWQVSLDGGTTWQPQQAGQVGANTYGGTTSDTMVISPLTGLNGRMYRLQGWTGTCDTISTAAVTLNVEGPLTFTDQPDDVTLCSNGATSFTIAINNATGVGTVQYQWEVSANGVTWSNLTNTAPYSGVTTNTLSISNVTGLYNYKYRCKVRTSNCDYSFSQLAQLFVEGPITIDDQPDNASVCSNIGHIFESTVTNPGSGAMQFQWQVSPFGSSTWSNITASQSTGNGGTYTGVKTMDLNISLVSGLNGYRYRLLIRTSQCFDTSNVVTLTVLDACLTGTCDFDLDGLDNNTDPDDDNDQLADVWEDYLTNNNVTDGWNYLDNTGGLLNYSNCNVDSDGDGILDGQEDPDGDNINNTEETDADGVFDGDPLDPCDPILGPTCVGINLAIKVYLQGAKIGTLPSDTLMRDNLRSYGNPATRLIPATEPYTALANFTHKGDGGGEIVEDSTTVFAVTGPNAIIDWVFVELRSSTKLDSVVTTKAGLLQRDGDVVAEDGTSPLRFPTANAGSFYVAVRHRNHLGVMTAEALDLSPIIQTVDFTDPTFLTNGNYAQVELAVVTPDPTDTDTRMFMWAGDLNSDGRTVYQGPGNDVLNLFTTVIADPDNVGNIANFIRSGYLNADVDLNGRAIYQGPSNDRSMLLFNTILSHPANVNNNANYVILEALP